MERKHQIPQPIIVRNNPADPTPQEILAWLDLYDQAYAELTPQGWQRWVFAVGFGPLPVRVKIGRLALARLKRIHGKDVQDAE